MVHRVKPPQPTPPKQDADKTGGPPPPSNSSYQFGDNQVDSSWFRRAVAAGLRYTKSRSERSGVKILPVLELEIAPGQESFKPQISKLSKAAAKAEAKGPAPARGTAPKPVAGGDGGAFGPPEKTLFKTAINQFLTYQEQKRATSAVRNVRMQQAATMIGADDDSRGIWIKRIAFLVIVGVLGMAFYKILAGRSGVQGKLRHYGQELDESELRESETVVAPKDKGTKTSKSGKLPKSEPGP